jgi:hypothetical protein
MELMRATFAQDQPRQKSVNSKVLVRDPVCLAYCLPEGCTPMGAALNKIIFVVPEAQKRLTACTRYVKAN